MQIAAYRDVCASVRDMAVHYHACADAAERELWASKARAALREGMEATCERAKQDDKQKMGTALVELQQLIRGVEATVQVVPSSGVKTKSATTRASAYNKSASRAVRISRAARSAMRRGYF